MVRHRPRSHRTGTIGVVLAVSVAVVGLGACSGGEERVTTGNVLQPGRPGEEVTTLPPGTTLPPSEDPFTEADVAFLVDMIPHHRQAMQMAALVPERAQNPTVVGLASRIADVQQAEIDVYERWLADHGLAPDGSPAERRGGDHGGHDDANSHTDMPGMASPAQLEELEASSGPAFDRLWLRLMVAHHEGALEMAAVREAGGTNIRVDELAADVVVTQTDEIVLMEGLLAGS